MNLPNKLSIIRITLVPIIVLVMIFPYAQVGIDLGSFQIQYVTLTVKNIIVLVLFMIASFTDFLDGRIARKRNMVTSFGKFIDPVADKLLVNTMFIMFAVQGIAPVVGVLLMIWRDTIVDVIRMIASSKGKVMAAGPLGKLKTVLQMVSIIIILLSNLPFELYRLAVADFIFWFATLVSVMSGISYFIQAKDIIMESK
ncbi:CDP-diacylglycerol--glycerol-3-phosphate 3-phosphatidyltransferase [bioreactor metagenome]|uniref:CDP-diacylglycerol--glycerol-3-phosphate 3-phosphatidyltransferase n=1 Tax=bioreactor metagenome TaxID=1076179 RepID=A0A645BK94_9ZZZZ|nr:CDP-diacylglycerol--glycerol-3-phosphate 3-phosphatidyltransferase [Erysipelotrichaceae bacterium]